ncbi:MAG: hypothetical protein IJC74_04565 [Clostridia bacterium]|nr:hypothetical protein [Clostridia bacterium]
MYLKYSKLLKNIKMIEESDLHALSDKLRMELLMNILRGATETEVDLDKYYPIFKEWQAEDKSVLLLSRHENLNLEETVAMIMFYFAQERFHENLCTDLLYDGTLLKMIKQVKNFIY